MRALRATALVASILTFSLIVLGALVRTTQSGMSCPDWPTCYGHWIPTPSEIAALPDVGYTYTQVMLEWVHRLIAGVMLGPLVLVLGVAAFLSRERHPRLGWAGPTAIVLLVVQASLGALTVFESNSPWSVAVHLGNAMLLLVTLLAIHDAARPVQSRDGPAWIRPAAALSLTLALLAMMSAAMTAKSGASLACSSWPLCEPGTWVPDFSDEFVAIHMTHRLLAAAFALSLIGLFVAARRDPGCSPAIRRQAALAAALVGLQVMFGALVIVLEVPIWKAVLHQATGVLTLVVVADLFWRVRARAATIAHAPGGTVAAIGLR